MTCEDLRRDAAGLAALAAGDPEREAAYAHARACPGCAAELRKGERLVSLLDALPPEPAPSGAALRRAAAPVLGDLPQSRPTAVLPLAAAAAAIVATVSARSHSGEARDWIAGAVLAIAAAGLAALASRGVRVAAAAVGLSVAFALAGGAGPLSVSDGLLCLGTELAAAAVPLVAALALSRRAGAGGAGRYAAAAAAGAVAGQAALQLTCHAPDAAAHLLVFHAGGVLAAAALGALAGARLRPAAARAA